MSGDDQAQVLRQLAEDQQLHQRRLPALVVTGGKGGVGKTTVAVNLALLLGRMGLHPLLVDCDLGLANADILLGVNPLVTLFDVIERRVPLSEAIVRDRRGLDLLPAASGREELTRLGNAHIATLLRALEHIARDYDLLVLDTAAGIQREVTSFVLAAREVAMVITPDPTSLTDAYALIKVSMALRRDLRFHVVVNNATSAQEAMQTFQRLQQVARTYLSCELALLGHLPSDRQVRASVRSRTPFVTNDDSPATQALKGIALRVKRMRWKEGA